MISAFLGNKIYFSKTLKEAFENYQTQNRNLDLDKEKSSNIVQLNMNILEEFSILYKECLRCKNCNAFLTQISQDNIFKTCENYSIWKCEFCHFENKLTQTEIIDKIPKESSFLHTKESLIQNDLKIEKCPPESVQTIKRRKIVFCIDISNSMNDSVKSGNQSSGMSSIIKETPRKIDCLKISIKEQLTNLVKTFPEDIVGLILFGSKVVIHGDCSNEQFAIKETLNYNYKGLLKLSIDLGEKYMTKSIKDSYNSIINVMDNLKLEGFTALGPGLLASIGLAFRGLQGSKIIICTDGCSNEGLGDLLNASGNLLDDSLKFYEQIGNFAKTSAIIISVISISDSESKLSLLCPIADLTGGNIVKINPLQLNENLTDFINEYLISTYVQLEVRIPFPFEFLDTEEIFFGSNKSILRKNIESVMKDSITTFEFKLKPIEEILKMKEFDMKYMKRIPIQVIMLFEKFDGIKYQKIITKIFEIEGSNSNFDDIVDPNIVANHILKNASYLAKKEKHQDSINYIDDKLIYFKKNINIEEIISDFRNSLFKCIHNSNPSSFQEDSITVKINRYKKKQHKKYHSII